MEQRSFINLVLFIVIEMALPTNITSHDSLAQDQLWQFPAPHYRARRNLSCTRVLTCDYQEKEIFIFIQVTRVIYNQLIYLYHRVYSMSR